MLLGTVAHNALNNSISYRVPTCFSFFYVIALLHKLCNELGHFVLAFDFQNLLPYDIMGNYLQKIDRKASSSCKAKLRVKHATHSGHCNIGKTHYNGCNGYNGG
jgi:hypothetical protein